MKKIGLTFEEMKEALGKKGWSLNPDDFSWKVVFVTAGGIYALCAISWLFINCTIPMIEEEDS